MKRNVDMAQENGASAWLTAIPRAVTLLCTKVISGTHCAFETNGHHLDCPHYVLAGRAQCFTRHGLSKGKISKQAPQPHLWHNDHLMTEVCEGVAIEPPLQPLNGERFSYTSAIIEDNARSDICAQGFWGNNSQRAFFDVRICNPTAQSYHNSSLEAVYRSQERGKHRQYEERVREVKMSSFTQASLQQWHTSIWPAWSKQSEASHMVRWSHGFTSRSTLPSSNPRSMQSEDTDLVKGDQSDLTHLHLPIMTAGHESLPSI